MANRTISDMSEEELITAQQHLDVTRGQIKAEMLVIQRELDRRATARRARETLERLSAPEKAALAQMINAGDIDTAGEVGRPGSM